MGLDAEGELDEKGLMRLWMPSGTIVYYEGEEGHERMVRQVCPD